MMWQNLLCGLTAGQVTAGRAAGYDVATFAVRADYGPSYCGAGRGGAGRGGAGRGGLRAQMSSPRKALIYIYIYICVKLICNNV